MQTVAQRRQELAEAAEADRVARDAAASREAERQKTLNAPKPGATDSPTPSSA